MSERPMTGAVGSTFDDFLDQHGIREGREAEARRRVGLWATLTPEQQARVLAYSGPDDIMPRKDETR